MGALFVQKRLELSSPAVFRSDLAYVNTLVFFAGTRPETSFDAHLQIAAGGGGAELRKMPTVVFAGKLRAFGLLVEQQTLFGRRNVYHGIIAAIPKARLRQFPGRFTSPLVNWLWASKKESTEVPSHLPGFW